MRDEALIKRPVGRHGNQDLGKQKSQGEMFARGVGRRRGETEGEKEGGRRSRRQPPTSTVRPEAALPPSIHTEVTAQLHPRHRRCPCLPAIATTIAC